MSNPKILIVDDDDAIRRSLKRHLKKEGWDALEAEDGETALKLVGTEKLDLLLLDIMMPGMDGYEVCRRLRASVKNQTLYIIMLSAKGKTDEKVEGLNVGADDYVTKPFEPPELLARIKGGLRTVEEKKLATQDALTGLYNRYLFNNFVAYEIERAKRHDQPLSLVLVDIDHFKMVNDNYGHDVGDLVLIALGELLQQQARDIDIPARWGGEEFVLLLADTDIEGASKAAERFRKAVEVFDFPKVGHITASFGVSMLGENMDATRLFKLADDALYKAKENGRNRVEKAQ